MKRKLITIAAAAIMALVPALEMNADKAKNQAVVADIVARMNKYRGTK